MKTKKEVLRSIGKFLEGYGEERWIVDIRLKKNIKAKRKGSAGELELVHELNERGFECRRSQQYCGDAGDADVVGLKGIFVECKRVQNLNIHEAMSKAVEQCKDDVPAIFHRKDNTNWVVTMGLDDWVAFYKEWECHMK